MLGISKAGVSITKQFQTIFTLFRNMQQLTPVIKIIQFLTTVSLQLREKDVVGDHVKGLQKSRQMTSVALPLSTDGVTPSQNATRLVGQDLPLVKPWLVELLCLAKPAVQPVEKPLQRKKNPDSLVVQRIERANSQSQQNFSCCCSPCAISNQETLT